VSGQPESRLPGEDRITESPRRHRVPGRPLAAKDKLCGACLDELQDAVWETAADGDLHALDRVLAIMARRAKLLGLDAPHGTPEEPKLDGAAVRFRYDLLIKELRTDVLGLEEDSGEDATTGSTLDE